LFTYVEPTSSKLLAVTLAIFQVPAAPVAPETTSICAQSSAIQSSPAGKFAVSVTL
jgi:hypothetical protein